MIGNIFLSALTSVALSIVGSRWIDRLYAREDAPLNFPNEIAARKKFRLPLLSIGTFVCLICIADRSLLEIFYLAIASFLLLLITTTDFEQYVIFDRMTLPLAIVGLLATISLQLPIEDRLLAAVLGGGALFAIAIITRGALGGGDIKLIAALGLWLGTTRLLDVICFGSIAGGIAALIMLAAKKMNRRDMIAYGPYFALTALYFLIAQPQ